jgi:hypothetical protein
MSEIRKSNDETIGLIRNTLTERDPTQQCIVLGSAAVVAHFYAAGARSPVRCTDVDALCSRDFFIQQLTDIRYRTGVSKIQVRWPKGRLALRGAKNLSLDIYPEEGEALLPFTAAHDMSDAWVPETYESAKEIAVMKAGIACKPINEILLQIAKIGRDKDIDNTRTVGPASLDAELITYDQAELIKNELLKTLFERERHPERYYPRIPL